MDFSDRYSIVNSHLPNLITKCNCLFTVCQNKAFTKYRIYILCLRKLM